MPRRPQVSVIRGACLFGLSPRSITSRIAKKTYGINTLTTYDAERHPLGKKVIIEGEEFSEDVFDAFVRKGDAVGYPKKILYLVVMKYIQRYTAQLGLDRQS